ncbi:phage major capsid protein, P2 family [Endozoicomonas sp. YOMI1]|uniref:phage major capsid protein, P2 family n=1 Tax=Endozoicomonas sp. YOMI1 TaxID=2828739 RepID=UPI0021473DEC|nr:phage major capsid protein, P2 family [Endozoicomonas sp. YOMI1]
MKKETRLAFNKVTEAMAKAYGYEHAGVEFAVDPSIAQKLTDKIVEQSTFLPRINVMGVDEMAGENIHASVSGPVSGRTDTSQNKRREPKDVLAMQPFRYQLYQTNTDVAIRYNKLDAWAKFPDMHNRYRTYVTAQIANDRELIGWHGTSVAKDTNIQTNPLLQDVNKGWMQYMRDNLKANVIAEGATSGELRIGAGGDYEGLDEAVTDLLSGIPQFMRRDLVVLIGDDLALYEKSRLMKALSLTPTEKNASHEAMMSFGGLPWETPSNFPPRGLVVTSLNNLSIYYQEDSWRRHVKEEPEYDRIADYNSRNEGYLVEEPRKFMALEHENVKLKKGDNWV